MKCAYCGGNITRRRWHSGTDKQKDVWFCTTAIRKGKKSCPECKAVEEKIIENAIVKAFNILCRDNTTIVEEFLENIEKELQSKDNKKLLNKIDGDIRNVENKVSKLLDLHLEDQIDKENYEEKYSELKKELQELKTEKKELGVVEDEEKNIKKRIASFRKLFESKEPLAEFDREVFKTVVEEVIIGGYKEDGSIDPYMLTFIFKTGLISKIEGHKQISKSEQNAGLQKCTYQEDEPAYWGIVGLLHDIDFEQYPQDHCIKAPDLLREHGVGEDIIRSVVSHGYGITTETGETLDIAPEHEMEKVLFATDELTGLIWAAALMRPSKSTKDMGLKSLKKKYKSKSFAAGCSREIIEQGADMLDWELDRLLSMTLQAMADTEDAVNQQMDLA